jgi:hypothetical protein
MGLFGRSNDNGRNRNRPSGEWRGDAFGMGHQRPNQTNKPANRNSHRNTTSSRSRARDTSRGHRKNTGWF